MTKLEPPRSPQASWSPEWARHTLDAWQRLLHLDRPQSYPRSMELFAQGGSPDEVFLLASGLVKLSCMLPDGEQVTLGLRLPGQFVEECAHGLDITYPVSAVAITSCLVHRVAASRVHRLLDGSLEANHVLVPMLMRDLHAQAVALVELKWLDAPARFERLLRDFAAILCPPDSQAPVSLPLPLTDRELGELLGISTGHIGRLKRQALERGLLQRRGRRVVLRTDC